MDRHRLGYRKVTIVTYTHEDKVCDDDDDNDGDEADSVTWLGSDLLWKDTDKKLSVPQRHTAETRYRRCNRGTCSRRGGRRRNELYCLDLATGPDHGVARAPQLTHSLSFNFSANTIRRPTH